MNLHNGPTLAHASSQTQFLFFSRDLALVCQRVPQKRQPSHYALQLIAVVYRQNLVNYCFAAFQLFRDSFAVQDFIQHRASPILGFKRADNI
jgi:hypothetical protein